MNNSENKEVYNNQDKFNADVAEIILELLKAPIKNMLTYCTDTHNAKPIKDILDIIKSCEYEYK